MKKSNIMVILALLGAGCDAENTDDEYYYDEDETSIIKDMCGQHPPKIIINANMPVNQENYEKPYGEDLTLYCSSENSENLEIKHDGKPIKFNVLNSTTIQLYVSQPDVDYYTYSCVDLNNDCEYALTVEIVPEMTISAKQVKHIVSDGWHEYFVPIGQDYEVFCTGNDIANLRIDNNNDTLESEIINRSTIKHIAHADRIGDKELFCVGSVADKEVIKMIIVTSDFYPDSDKFWCSIDSWSTLQCFWDYLGDIDRFKLFYTVNDEEIILCDEKAGSPNDTCEWDIDLRSYRKMYLQNKEMLLTLEVCTEFVCNSKLYSMNAYAITILNTVSKLSVISTSESDALLEWSSRVWGRSAEAPEFWGHESCETCVYKVEYRMTYYGEDWRKGNTSSVRCDWRVCKFKLDLPFPSSQYEVRVSVRFGEANDDRLWSVPQSVSAETLQKEECECNEESIENISCEFCSLKEYIIRESLAIKNKIKSSLKEKLGRINELSALLSTKQEINNKINRI